MKIVIFTFSENILRYLKQRLQWEIYVKGSSTGDTWSLAEFLQFRASEGLAKKIQGSDQDSLQDAHQLLLLPM